MLILIQDRGSGWQRFLCISPHQSDERRSIEDGGRCFWTIEIDFMDGHEPKFLIRHQIRNILYITLTRFRLLDGVCSPWKGWKYLEKMVLNMEPAVGIEPTTDGLQNRCSTAELSWPLVCHSGAEWSLPCWAMDRIVWDTLAESSPFLFL